MTSRHTVPTLLLALALVAAACGGDTGPAGGGTTSPGPSPGGAPGGGQLGVAVASYDVAVDDDARLLVGLFTPDRRPVGGGEVALDLAYLGSSGSGEPQPGPSGTATFLPVPGDAPPTLPDAPTELEDGVGVYQARVALDRPGVWQVTVSADLDGEATTGSAAFQVLPEPQAPAVGDTAPSVDILTLASDAPRAAIDSRAGLEGGEIPDPELHDTTVAEARAAGRPFVVVLSTPVFCVSQFCGPITDTVQEMAGSYGDRAEFIHIEVWRDFESKELNPGVQEWTAGSGEPWVFLVGADGTIQARWDNVLDAGELTAMLDQLPAA